MPKLRKLPITLLLLLVTVPSSAQTLEDPGLTIDTVYTGVSLPTQLIFFDPGGPTDFLILEGYTGQVVRVVGGSLSGVALDVHVNTADGHGLLGLALHPDFSTNGFAYIYYSESTTAGDSNLSAEVAGNRLYRYTWNGSAFVSPLLILDLPADIGEIHHGGLTLFGPDEKLYTTLGDQNRRGELQNRAGGGAPDGTSVIFRLNDDGTSPVDNPFAAVTGYEPYYAYGMRNVYGLDFDPVSGVLWQTDNGAVTMDEINRVDPGFNSGWAQFAGPEALSPLGVSDLVMVAGAVYSDPEFTFFNSRGINAIKFLNSTALGTEYENDMFVADVIYQGIYRFELDGARQAITNLPPDLQDLMADDETEADQVRFGSGFSTPVDIDVGPDGLLYILERSGGGSVLRVRPKVIDFLTDDAQLDVVCDNTGMATVTGNYQAYGTSLPATVQVDFYLDVPLQPANLLASFTDISVADGADVQHQFQFAWPDQSSHTVYMVVDGPGTWSEDEEGNNQAQEFEECQEFVVAAPETPPAAVQMLQNVPNPFNPSTQLRFILAEDGPARLTVYDIAGRRVASLLDEQLTQGEHFVTWHGVDGDGHNVPSGIYLAVLDAAQTRNVVRMVLLK